MHFTKANHEVEVLWLGYRHFPLWHGGTSVLVPLWDANYGRPHTHIELAANLTHLLGERPEQLEVVSLQAALAGKRLEHLLDLVHVLALVQVRPQQRAHYVPLHQPRHCLL